MAVPEIAERIFSPASPLPAEVAKIDVAEAQGFVARSIGAAVNNEPLLAESFPAWFALAPETDLSVVLEQSHLSLQLAGGKLSESEQTDYTAALRTALERESDEYKAEGLRLQATSYTEAQQMFERAHIRAAKLVRTAEYTTWEEIPDPVYMKKDLVAHVTITDPTVHAHGRDMIAAIVEAKNVSWFSRTKVTAEQALASGDPEALQSAYNSFSVFMYGAAENGRTNTTTAEAQALFLQIRDALRTAKLDQAHVQFDTIRTQKTEADFWNIVKSLNLVDFLNNGGQKWDGSRYDTEAHYIPLDKTQDERSTVLRDRIMARINEIQWENYNPFSVTSRRPIGEKPAQKAA